MNELFSQALNLVIYGMGTVFVFLTLLVGCTVLMSHLLREPASEAAEADPGQGIEPELLAAIAAAVKQYRSKN